MSKISYKLINSINSNECFYCGSGIVNGKRSIVPSCEFCLTEKGNMNLEEYRFYLKDNPAALIVEALEASEYLSKDMEGDSYFKYVGGLEMALSSLENLNIRFDGERTKGKSTQTKSK